MAEQIDEPRRHITFEAGLTGGGVGGGGGGGDDARSSGSDGDSQSAIEV